jgi:hypothetical protein
MRRGICLSGLTSMKTLNTNQVSGNNDDSSLPPSESYSYAHLVYEKWTGDQKIIGDAVPVIRLGEMDVIFCSLGAPTEAVREQAASTLRMYKAHDALVAALREVVEWRDGPEGPDVLFGRGSKMMDSVRAALKAATQK